MASWFSPSIANKTANAAKLSGVNQEYLGSVVVYTLKIY